MRTRPLGYHAPPLPPLQDISRPPRPKGGKDERKIVSRHAPILPVGPRLYRSTRINAISATGPGLPPDGFVTRNQTASEWIWYWASKRVLDPEQDPRKGPFWGGQAWAYQSQQLSLIPGVHTKALSTNIDFLYMLSWPYIAVRIQTFRYHTGATSLKQAYDRAQAIREYGPFNEVDVYEQDFLGDASGATAIILLKETLGLIRRLNPDTTGTTHQVANPYNALSGKD